MKTFYKAWALKLSLEALWNATRVIIDSAFYCEIKWFLVTHVVHPFSCKGLNSLQIRYLVHGSWLKWCPEEDVELLYFYLITVTYFKIENEKAVPKVVLLKWGGLPYLG